MLLTLGTVPGQEAPVLRVFRGQETYLLLLLAPSSSYFYKEQRALFLNETIILALTKYVH